ERCARRRAARAPGHVRAFRDRPRRDDLPARRADDDLPPHGRAELDRDRDRARRHERRLDPAEPAAALGVVAADALADAPLRHLAPERDLPPRETDETMT